MCGISDDPNSHTCKIGLCGIVQRADNQPRTNIGVWLNVCVRWVCVAICTGTFGRVHCGTTLAGARIVAIFGTPTPTIQHTVEPTPVFQPATPFKTVHDYLNQQNERETISIADFGLYQLVRYCRYNVHGAIVYETVDAKMVRPTEDEILSGVRRFVSLLDERNEERKQSPKAKAGNAEPKAPSEKPTAKAKTGDAEPAAPTDNAE